ncbi:hypothetical protein [Actinomadura sp. 3N407]|uniref:hypothetical protein n=1 Tax=Actinomadura sp. 3N407 TaxID=3457423 RepID=UPI003FCC74A4
MSGCFRRDKDGASLALDLELSRRVAFGSATDEAREDMALERRRSPYISTEEPRSVPVHGLGDEAWRLPRREEAATDFDLVVRHANVLVKVYYYNGERPAAQGEADAIALVRATIARIRT